MLEAKAWINSAPINLSELKGKSVILHFWGIDCVPCMSELDRLERQYGKDKIGQDKIFISIHPPVDTRDRTRLDKVIKDKGITFPIMIDKELEGKPFWGQTFMKYRINSIPCDIQINDAGLIIEGARVLIDEDSDWVKRPY